MDERLKLRRSFTEVAELYHRIRPHYPAELFQVLEREAGLREGDRLLEIGPGSGQATLPLARRGYQIEAVELGEEMAELARRELADYPRVRVLNLSFEEAELPENAYALVYSATAFHWINPEARFSKPHRLLREGGHLAIIHTHYISDTEEDPFFRLAQPVYQRYQAQETEETEESRRLHMPRPHEVRPAQLDPELFSQRFFQNFLLTRAYTAEQYSELLSTYSTQRVMPEDKREAFLSEIRELIEREFSGMVSRDFLISLTVARRV